MAPVPLPEFDLVVTDQLRSYGTPRFYPVGSYLFHQGDPAGNVLLVESGTVRIERYADGHDGLVEVAQRGAIIGDLGVIDDQPRPAAAIATADTTVLRISAERFHSIFRENPSLQKALLIRSMRQMRLLYEPAA